MKNSNTKYYISALILLGGLYGSSPAMASGKNNARQNALLNKCEYPILATNLIAPKKFGTKNTTVCVDYPVSLEKVKVIFNMDTDSVDGKGNANGLKHLVMIGNVMKEQIEKHQINPKNISIIGIIHGTAIKWATKAGSVPQRKFINAIFKLKREGVNIHLEACGVTMNGAGLTKKDLYSYDAHGNPDPKAGGRIYVNQGAFGREIYLQNHGYAYVEEGYDLHLKK